MSIDLFIPEVWSARLQRHLDRKLIYAQPSVCNRNWEGEIADAGDTVHINKISDPTILDYAPGTDLAAAEAPDGSTTALVIDKLKAFNVLVDDVNAAQANVALLDQFATRAGVKLAQAIDSIVSAAQVAAATVNKVGTDAVPVAVQADGKGDYTPYDLAVEIRRQLAAQNADLDGLWMAIGPDLEAEILKDPNYISSGSEIGAQFVRNGLIGQIAGFDVLRTTGVPTSAGSGGTKVKNTKILAGDGNYATTFASQIVKTEAYRPQLRFADAVKGLNVFGVKVIEPETLAVAHVAHEEAG